MKDTWWNHNTDKILLYSLVVFTGLLTLHIIHHGAGDKNSLEWAENAFSTVLGALILILTGRISRADNGNAPVVKPEDKPPVPPA